MSISTSIDQGILTIEFDRAEKKNAITAAMYQAMPTHCARPKRTTRSA